jgi:hypothetical protein
MELNVLGERYTASWTKACEIKLRDTLSGVYDDSNSLMYTTQARKVTEQPLQ